jgi:lipase chaperone LimK
VLGYESKYSLLALEKKMGNDLAQMNQQDKLNVGYLKFLSNQMGQRNAPRVQHFDLAVYETFYAQVQRYDEYTYSKLLVNSDTTLSASERADILNRQGLVTDQLSTQVDALRALLFDEWEQIRVGNIERHGEV